MEEEEWKTLYRYIKKHSIATQKRDFMYKWICLGPYTNHRYASFGAKKNKGCHYCECERQDFQHLYQECPEVKALRERIAIKWDTEPTMKEWLVGNNRENKQEKAKTHIIFELNHIIQKKIGKANHYRCHNSKVT